MIKTGLLSVTFRQLTAERIIELVKEAGLDSIEWGGDIHVPHGDVERAKEVRRMCEAAGITIAAYGSYYRTGVENEQVGPFEKVLETAVALGAPLVRVWAGNKGSQEADEQMRARVIEDSRAIAEMASKVGVTVCYEYHGNTLTDTNESATRLLAEVDHANMKSMWQPPVGISFEERLQGLEDIKPWITNMHVFYWIGTDRQPLIDGKHEWETYLKHLAALDGEHYALLEFVKENDPEQFLRDAATLKNWVETANLIATSK